MQFISLSVLVFCLCLATSTLYEANGKDVVIFRGERDRFTNVVGCNMSNAVCSDAEGCVDCHCMVNQTFIQTRGQYGKCVSNELMVYATSYEDSFLLQLDLHKFCLYQKFYTEGTFVLAGATCGYDNWDYRWIWTNFGQLLNWQTLECMTDDLHARKYKYFVTMKKCDRNNQRQLWKCVDERIKSVQSGRHMYYGEYYTFVTTTNYYWGYASKWTHFGSKKDVCSQGFHDDNDGDDNDGDDSDGDNSDGDDNDGNDNDDNDGDDNDGDSNGGDNNDGNGGDKTNKDKTDADQKNNGGDKDNTQTIIIIVCVLVVLLLTSVVVFVIYRYRNRFVRSGSRNSERQDVPPKQEYANAMNPLYPTNNNYSGQRECELYESTPDHVYQCVDTDHKTAGPPPQHLTYDYAVVDGPLTKSEQSSVEFDATTGGKDTPLDDEGLRHDKEEQTGETKDRTHSTKPPPHKHHVFEGP